jgi:hypothetical protein
MIILPSLIDAINLGVIFVELRTFQLKPMSNPVGCSPQGSPAHTFGIAQDFFYIYIKKSVSTETYDLFTCNGKFDEVLYRSKVTGYGPVSRRYISYTKKIFSLKP